MGCSLDNEIFMGNEWDVSGTYVYKYIRYLYIYILM